VSAITPDYYLLSDKAIRSRGLSKASGTADEAFAALL
jgi:hypothetical protein